MNKVQQAIRDAAEKGGYRYRWWKVNDLEQSEGYNGLLPWLTTKSPQIYTDGPAADLKPLVRFAVVPRT